LPNSSSPPWVAAKRATIASPAAAAAVACGVDADERSTEAAQQIRRDARAAVAHDEGEMGGFVDDFRFERRRAVLARVFEQIVDRATQRDRSRDDAHLRGSAAFPPLAEVPARFQRLVEQCAQIGFNSAFAVAALHVGDELADDCIDFVEIRVHAFTKRFVAAKHFQRESERASGVRRSWEMPASISSRSRAVSRV
jgi:hypothetical protein